MEEMSLIMKVKSQFQNWYFNESSKKKKKKFSLLNEIDVNDAD